MRDTRCTWGKAWHWWVSDRDTSTGLGRENQKQLLLSIQPTDLCSPEKVLEVVCEERRTLQDHGYTAMIPNSDCSLTTPLPGSSCTHARLCSSRRSGRTRVLQLGLLDAKHAWKEHWFCSNTVCSSISADTRRTGYSEAKVFLIFVGASLGAFFCSDVGGLMLKQHFPGRPIWSQGKCRMRKIKWVQAARMIIGSCAGCVRISPGWKWTRSSSVKALIFVWGECKFTIQKQGLGVKVLNVVRYVEKSKQDSIQNTAFSVEEVSAWSRLQWNGGGCKIWRWH